MSQRKAKKQSGYIMLELPKSIHITDPTYHRPIKTTATQFSLWNLQVKPGKWFLSQANKKTLLVAYHDDVAMNHKTHAIKTSVEDYAMTLVSHTMKKGVTTITGQIGVWCADQYPTDIGMMSDNESFFGKVSTATSEEGLVHIKTDHDVTLGCALKCGNEDLIGSYDIGFIVNEKEICGFVLSLSPPDAFLKFLSKQ